MDPIILTFDFVKLMRPYLYNNIYNRQDANAIMLNYCREHSDCNGEPYFTYYPYSLHVPIKGLDVDGYKMMNGMLYRVLVQFEAAVLDCIRQLSCGYGDVKEMYRFLLANVQYLYTGCKLTGTNGTELITYL